MCTYINQFESTGVPKALPGAKRRKKFFSCKNYSCFAMPIWKVIIWKDIASDNEKYMQNLATFFGVISRKPYVPWRDQSWPILAYFQKEVPPLSRSRD